MNAKILHHASFALLAMVMTASPAWSQGTTITDSQGFEAFAGYSTTFLGTGQLEGQPTSNPWLRTVGGLSSAYVQNTVVGSGGQAVQVNRTPNSNDRWAQPVFGWPSQPCVVIDWDMRVQETPGPASSFGPFFGSEAYDTDGISGGIGLLGSLGVDASNGDVLYQAEDTGFLTEAGAVVGFDQWHHFRIILDYNFDQYAVYLDNTFLAMTGFVDRGNNLNEFTDADISTFSAAGDAASRALAGVAFFDNFMVRQFPNKASIPPAQIIPEPSSLVIVGLGVAALACIRRRLN